MSSRFVSIGAASPSAGNIRISGRGGCDHGIKRNTKGEKRSLSTTPAWDIIGNTMSCGAQGAFVHTGNGRIQGRRNQGQTNRRRSTIRNGNRGHQTQRKHALERVVVCGGVWWCVVVCGGVWWCVVVCGGVCMCECVFRVRARRRCESPVDHHPSRSSSSLSSTAASSLSVSILLSRLHHHCESPSVISHVTASRTKCERRSQDSCRHGHTNVTIFGEAITVTLTSTTSKYTDHAKWQRISPERLHQHPHTPSPTGRPGCHNMNFKMDQNPGDRIYPRVGLYLYKLTPAQARKRRPGDEATTSSMARATLTTKR